MADAGILISWGSTARGREHQASEVLQASLQYWQRLKDSGAIEDFRAHFTTTGNASQLAGFVLIEGERFKLTAARSSEEWSRLMLESGLVVDNLTETTTITGAAFMQALQTFEDVSASLRS